MPKSFSIQPSVSIVIPVRNGAHFLPRAVASALGQQHRPLEVIVVDNNSTDTTAEVLATLAKAHPEVKATSCSTPGAAAARNRGLREAQGDWVQFLDVDDTLYPEKVATQLANYPAKTQWIIGGYRNQFRSGSY
ncbi:MAG: glycosyltransferase family A protein, partial [Bacteroidota bacterium]